MVVVGGQMHARIHTHTTLVRKPARKKLFKDLSREGRIKTKQFLKILGVRIRTGMFWLKTGSSSRHAICKLQSTIQMYIAAVFIVEI
jgi:hypothetical protein